MKIFGVTETELRTLSIINAATAAFVGLGSGCIGYLLNLDASIALADRIPAVTKALLNYVQPGLFWLGISFYGMAAVLWVGRGRLIDTIKTESDPAQRQASPRKGFFARIGNAWDALWATS